MVIDSTGNVGIGSTAPNNLLDVNIATLSPVSTDEWPAHFGWNMNTGSGVIVGIDNTGTATKQADIAFESQGTPKWYLGMDNTDANTATFSLLDLTSGTNAIFVNTSDQVGIGTTTIVSFLTVNGDIDLPASDYINFGGTDGSGGYGFRDSGGTMQRKNSGGSWATISTTSDQRLKRDVVPLSANEGLAAIMKLAPRPVSLEGCRAGQGRRGADRPHRAGSRKSVSCGHRLQFRECDDGFRRRKKEKVEHARGLYYEKLVPPLIKALQEEQAQIESLKAANDKEAAALAALHQELAALKAAHK